MHRRRLLKRAFSATATITIGTRLLLPVEAACWARVVVIVRQGPGVVAVDPLSGKVTPAAEHATPATETTGVSAPVEPPAALRSVGGLDYWMQSDDGSAFIYRRASSSGASWWWLGETSRILSALPSKLEPGLPSGSAARWFHGASFSAEHLGAGSLRLMAVNVDTGEVVLDEVVARRLELAATAVSDDGAVVAHVQGGNTRIDLWVADLSRQVTSEITVPVDPPAPVAPSEIDLHVINDGIPVVAAGAAWSSPAHPEPFVIIAALGAGEEPVLNVVPGELVGIAASAE